MKKETACILKSTTLTTFLALLLVTSGAEAQETRIAVEAPAGTVGNMWNSPPGSGANPWPAGQSVAVDFTVLSAIKVDRLGVFDDATNGINGGAVLTVELYERTSNTGTLLEGATFDAANPGALIGGSRFKSLAVPVTLTPGLYSIVAYGFDETNRWAALSGRMVRGGLQRASVNDGDGRIRFETVHRGRVGGNHFPMGGEKTTAENCAAGTFTYSAVNLPRPTYAADYQALVDGVTTFHFGYRRRTGSIALFSHNSFPVIMEPSGSRLVLEGAGVYNDDPAGARCVAFSHPQWAHADDVADGRTRLFANAINWAARKNNPADVVIGLGPLLNTNFLAGLGYNVRPFPAEMALAKNGLPECDVVVVDGHAGFDDAALKQLADFTARGGGLVIATSPWELVHGGIQAAFYRLNELLEPFGLTYRPSTTIVSDFGFTNVSAQPIPAYFSAFPAAELLGQEKQGKRRLDSLEKTLALSTLNYALNARPELLSALGAASSGSPNGRNETVPPGKVTSFTDVIVLRGSQASTNRLGAWTTEGNDLVASERRGSVDYNFDLPAADVYRLVVEGGQNQPRSREKDFKLLFSVDGTSLSHYVLEGSNGVVSCWTPHLAAGPHTLRIFWDNAASYTSLRLKNVRLQKAAAVEQGNPKEWSDRFVRSRSGLDGTNELLTSYVSPICLEGRDPYPSLVRLRVKGSRASDIPASPAPNDRWYANVPLSADQHTPLILNISYQNEGVSEWKRIQWLPVNLLKGTDLTVRRGDSLLLTARPDETANGEVVITVGTNRLVTTGKNPLAHRFEEAGVFTVTGTYGGAQEGSIKVKVVAYEFPADPDSWVAAKRNWDLPGGGADEWLEADSRLIFEQTAGLSDGRRMGLIADDNEPRYVLCRLGRNGPILDSARVNGFDFWHGGETYVKVLKTYADGSQDVEMLLVMSPVLPDVRVQLDVIVGGAVFENGTTAKTLGASDFDSEGECRVRFLRPATAVTSVCHSIKLFQGTELLGNPR